MGSPASRNVAVTAPSTAPLDRVQSARLLLERLAADDLGDWCRMHADPRVMATLGGLRSEDESAAMLSQALEHWERHGFGLWTLRLPEARRYVGRGGLRQLRVGGNEEVEIAYALLPEYWGRGLATEVAAASARVAFQELGRSELVAFTLPANHASRRVMEKVGFRYERDIVHADLLHVLYRLTAADWRAGLFSG